MTEAINWRKQLADLGGYDNELLGVPAGSVRKIIDELERLRARVAELSGEAEPVGYIRTHEDERGPYVEWYALAVIPDGVEVFLGPKTQARQPIQHVGESNFESWYESYKPSGGDKQRARDAYAAGMVDSQERQPMSDEDIDKLRDIADHSFRRHKYSVRGQQITPADDWNTHFARAIEAHITGVKT